MVLYINLFSLDTGQQVLWQTVDQDEMLHLARAVAETQQLLSDQLSLTFLYNFEKRSRGHCKVPDLSHCVVSLSKTLYPMLSTGQEIVST